MEWVKEFQFGFSYNEETLEKLSETTFSINRLIKLSSVGTLKMCIFALHFAQNASIKGQLPIKRPQHRPIPSYGAVYGPQINFINYMFN